MNVDIYKLRIAKSEGQLAASKEKTGTAEMQRTEDRVISR